MSVEEFKRHYWYTDELRSICADYNLTTTGTKATLNKRIEGFLDGEQMLTLEKIECFKLTLTDEELGLAIDLDSDQYKRLSIKVVKNFSFNDEWRNFCGQVFGDPNFKFTKDMAAAMREAKKRKDDEMTLKDLLIIYKLGKERKKSGEALPSYMQSEEETYQWNNFVK